MPVAERHIRTSTTRPQAQLFDEGAVLAWDLEASEDNLLQVKSGMLTGGISMHAISGVLLAIVPSASEIDAGRSALKSALGRRGTTGGMLIVATGPIRVSPKDERSMAKERIQLVSARELAQEVARLSAPSEPEAPSLTQEIDTVATRYLKLLGRSVLEQRKKRGASVRKAGLG